MMKQFYLSSLTTQAGNAPIEGTSATHDKRRARHRSLAAFAGREVCLWWLLAICLLLGSQGRVFAQACTGGSCTQSTTTNTMPGTNNFSTTFCITTVASYTQGFDMNGGTACIGAGVTFSPSPAGNYNGNWTINNYGTCTRDINLGTGQTFNNYGTFTGQLVMGGGTFNNQAGGAASPSSVTLNGGSLTNALGGSLTLPGAPTLSSGMAITNSGVLNVTAGLLTFNSGSSAMLGGTNNLNSVSNVAGIITIAGTVNVSGNYSQGTGTTQGGTGVHCNYLNVTGTIQGSGTYSGTNGLVLNQNLTPACAGCLTGGTQTSAPAAPANQFASPTLAVSGTNINGTVANPGGAPASTHYIILRRLASAVSDVPVAMTTYAVGDVIGSSTVVAINPVATLTFTDAGPATLGCATYNYAIYGMISSGGCGNYMTTIGAGNRASVAFSTVGGAISPASATVCSGSTSGTLTLSGQTGSVMRWESSTDGFVTSTPIATTATTYTSGALSTSTQFRAVINAGTGCGNVNSSAAAVTVNATPVGGSISPSTVAVCNGSTSGVLTLSGQTGSVIRWESCNNAAFTSPVTIANTTTTYTSGALSANKWFRAVVNTGGGCANVYSASVAVTVTPASVGGSLSPSTVTVCNGSGTTLTLSGQTGSIIRWESSANASFSAPAAISNTTTTLATGALSANTWYRAVVNNGGGCSDANSAASAVTVQTVLAPYGTDNARCGAGAIALLATPYGTGETIDWYAAATGGSVLSTGTVYNVSITANTYYYAQARNTTTGCISATRKPIQGIITPPASVTATAVGGGAYCVGFNTTLTSTGTNTASSNVYWTGPNYFFSTSPNINFPSIAATSAGLYTVTASNISEANTLVNGDFEAGNTGFTSSYTNSPTNLYAEGTYGVITKAHNAHGSFAYKGDHTTGTGLQMVVNGATTAGVVIWSETVPVDPNQDYQLSYWETSVHPTNGSILQLYVNGAPAGYKYQVGLDTSTWTHFYYNWNSGSATTAVLTLLNEQTAASGNDFALDDINFQQVCDDIKTLTITVGSPVVPTGTGAQRCGPGTVTLSAAATSPVVIDWYAAATGGSALASGSSTYTPSITGTTTYYAEARNPNGNCVSASRVAVTATMNPQPTITSFTPTSGGTGTTVSLVGTNFSTVNSVTFGGTAAAGFAVASGTSMSAVVGSGASGAVTVNTGLCNATLAGFTYTTPPSRILDVIGVAQAATFSVRQLRGAAPLSMRVRRSSDNATADIGFTASGDLDTASLKAFAGAGGSAFVVTWYDQSGLGRDAVQATASAQPQILAGGLMNRSNSRPALLLSGAQTLQSPLTGTQATTGGTAATISSVFSSTAGVNGSLISDNNGTNRFNIHAPWSDGNTYVDIGDIGSGGRFSGALPWSSLEVGTFMRSGAQGDVWQDGVNRITTSAMSSTVTGTSPMSIGSYSPSSYFMQGQLPELISFPTALSTANRVALECDQKTYYNVQPTLASVSPTNACPGGTMTVTGTHLNQVTAVTVGGQTAAYTVNAAGTSITVTVPASPTTGTMALTHACGTLSQSGLTYNLPAPPATAGAAQCGTGTVTLTATPGTGEVIDWYAAATGGSALATATSTYTTPIISATMTYYAVARATNGNCVSATRSAAVATINNATLPAGTGASICGTGTVMISATPGTGEVIRWYAASTGGAILATSSSYTTPSISTTTTYYAEAYNSTTGCISATRTAVVATVNAVPTTPTGAGAARCGTGTVAISATPGAGETIDWYAAASGGSILTGGTGTTSFTTPSISATTTYYAESRNTTTGCTSSARVAVTATVNTVPGAPTAGNSASCGTGTVTITATPGAGETIDWYAAATGGSILTGGTGTTSFTTPSISATTTYYAEARNSTTGCLAASRTAVTATVNAVPASATASNSSRCGTGTVAISATPGTGETIDWYAASTGGTALASGSTSFMTPSISTTTTYYAEARNSTSGCLSAARAAVVATVNAVPASPTAGNAARCGTGTVTITSTPGAGETIDWYAASTGGSVLAGGTGTTSYTTPSISTTTTYYAQARNTTTGCLAAARVAVTAAVNAVPATATAGNAARCGTGSVTITATPGTGETIDWYAAATGGSALTTASASYTTPSISATTTYYAESRNTTTGCISATRTAVTATVNAFPGSPTAGNGSRCGTGTVTITAAPGTGETIDWYANSTGGTALATGSTTFTTPSITTTTTYYAEARNSTSGCLSAARVAVTATVNTVPGAPTAGNGSRCGTGSVAISATPGTGETIDWYAAATGGSILTGGTGTTTFNTPSISATTTYYAEARNSTTNCLAAARVAVTATVNPRPAQPTATGTVRCNTGSVTVTATPGTGEAIDWYDAATGGTLLALASNSYTGTISSTTTYYAEARNTTTGCVSATRRAATATVNITNPPTGVPGSGCGPGTVGISAVPAAGEVIRWYAAPTGGGILVTSNTYSPTNITTTTTYYAEAYNSSTGCTSPTRTAVVATVYPVPDLDIASTGAVCLGTGTLSMPYTAATNGANQYMIDWNAAANSAGLPDVGWTAIPPSAITVTGIPSTLGTYSAQVSVRNTTTGCVASLGAATVCGTAAENSSLTLTAPAGATFTNLDFASYGVANGSCGTFSLGSCNATTSYSVVQTACVGRTTCTIGANNGTFGDPCVGTYKQLFVQLTSDAPGLVLTVEDYPSAPASTTGGNRCSTGSVTLTATAPTGQTVDWYAAASGGSILAGGTGTLTFNTPSISTTTTYYAQARTVAASCSSSGRTPVVATINAPPAASITGTTTICAGGSTTLTASAGTSWSWSSGQSTQAITVSPTSTTTYTVTVNSSGGCTNTASATVTVNQLPTATVGALSPVCQGTAATSITYSGVTNGGDQYMIDWNAAANTAGLADVSWTALSGGTIPLTGLPSTAGTYSADVTLRNSTTGCSAPLGTNMVCGTVGEGGSLTLTAPSGTFYNIDFASYGNPTGTCGSYALGSCNASSSMSIVQAACVGLTTCTIAATNGTFTDPCGGTLKNLRVQARTTGISLTINPAATVASSAGAARCGTGTVTISATPGTGQTIDWYAAATGGTALVTASNSYTTPSISTTTTYYAQARNTTTSCLSLARTAVTATVNAVPATPTGTAGSRCGTGTVALSAAPGTGETVDWYAAATGGTALLAGNVNYTTPSISATTTYYAESRNTTTGCISATRTAVVATVNTVPASPTAGNAARCGTGTVTITATPGAGQTIDWYAAATGGTALATASTSYATPSISSTTTYYGEARNTTTGCLSSSRVAVTATVNAVPSAATAGNNARCGTGTVGLSATPGTGETIDWYAAASGGTALLAGNVNYTTPSISTTTTYYAEARNTTTGCISASRVAVTATVNGLPATATAGNAARCGTGTVTITASPATGETVDWYAASTGGSVLAGGIGTTSYTTPSISSTTTYYAETRNTTTGCISATRVAVTATVNAVPASPTAGNNARCGTGTVTISATPGTGETIDWYAASTGGVALATASTSYTTPSISTTTTYYAQARNTTTGCLAAARVAVTATINAIPAVPAGAGAQRCDPGTLTLSATPGTGETIDWYAAATGGSALTTASASYTTPSISATTTYYAESRNTTTGCLSATRTAVTATVTPMPTASISYAGTPFCQTSGGTKTVSLTGTSGGTYASTTGLSLNGGTGAVDVAASTAGSYTVTYTIAAAGGCPAVTANTGIVLNPNVTLPTTPSGPAALCQGASATAFTTTSSNYSGLTWSVTGTGNSVSGSGTSVSVSWAPAFSGTATVSVTAAGCGGPLGPASTTVNVRSSGTWLGLSADWNSAPNWCGGVPTTTTDVYIPNGVAFMPATTAGSFAHNLTVPTGSSLTVANGTSLNISGGFTPTGSVTLGATSTVTYSSATAQAIPVLDYGNLTTTGTGTKTLSSTGTTRISGAFTPGTSAFVTTGSTVEFNGSSAQNIPAFSFNNLTTSGSNVKTMTGDVTVGGTLSLTNGSLAIGANALDLNGPVDPAGTGTLSGGCSSTLHIGGSAATGTLKFTAGANTLGTLGMSKTSYLDTYLGNDLNICTQLNLVQGKIVLGSSNLTLLPGANTTNGNDNSYVVTMNQKDPAGVGFFIQQMVIGAGQRTFPIGSPTSYTPAYLANVGTTRNVKARVFDLVYDYGITGNVITNITAAVQKSWQIEPLAGPGSPNVSVKLQWNPGDEGIDFATARTHSELPYIGKNANTGSSAWMNEPVSGFNYSTTPFTISTPSISTFSTFAIGSLITPLPIHMGDLTVTPGLRANALHWETYEEREAKGFAVLRSANGRDYAQVGYLRAAGRGRLTQRYSFDDPAQGSRVYYKLKYMGLDTADFAYSNVVTVMPTGTKRFNVHPNPTNGVLFVDGDGFDGAKLTELSVSDIQGKVHRFSLNPLQTGHYQIDLRVLPVGTYVVEGLADGMPVGRVRVVVR